MITERITQSSVRKVIVEMIQSLKFFNVTLVSFVHLCPGGRELKYLFRGPSTR